MSKEQRIPDKRILTTVITDSIRQVELTRILDKAGFDFRRTRVLGEPIDSEKPGEEYDDSDVTVVERDVELTKEQRDKVISNIVI